MCICDKIWNIEAVHNTGSMIIFIFLTFILVIFSDERQQQVR